MNVQTLSRWLVVTACATCMGLAGGVGGVGGKAKDLSPPENPRRILMLLPISSRSDVEVFMSFAEGLAYSGHRIVMLVNQPPERKNYNVFQLFHGLEEFQPDKEGGFESSDSVLSLASSDKLASFARKLYKVQEVKTLYEMRQKFDLIVIHPLLNEVAYPFLHDMPFITLSTTGIDVQQSAVLGNVLNPASEMAPLRHPLDVLRRFQSTLTYSFHLWYWKYWTVVPAVQKEISAQFPDLPPLLDIERKQSLALVNSHFSLGSPVPLLPSQVEVAGLHCRPSLPLPRDVDSWISDAGEAGVVYFSLGSGKRASEMPLQYRQLLLQAFGKLEQRVIWQYEEEIVDLPENVMIKEWLPQQDVLAHPNVKVFISRADFISTEEAVCHAKPVLALRISAEQTQTAAFIKDSGFGLALAWEELTEELVLEALREIIGNPKYQKAAAERALLLHDRLQSPLDLALYWAEYVMRHKGAPRLRSPAADLSWVEFLHLDILVILHLVLLLILILPFVILKRRSRFNSGEECGAEKLKAE
ncbi:UDP-glycosyltransferase UGT5-like [Penaeus japonicus]|uniref:UDP-glycosyltransferase UGT5-like n=1 Tax=Penaeus japonicus TaxID=27405 RepID=UPI001C716DD2|nr:UDP-glycosyltransferase UGT5-like [Penaeus japonicus]